MFLVEGKMTLDAKLHKIVNLVFREY